MRAVPSVRRARSRRSVCRPRLLALEERLPLGDGVLGLLVGASLLPAHAAPSAVQRAPQTSGEPGVLTPGSGAVTRSFTAPARPADGVFAATLDEVGAATPPWDALATTFAASARWRPSTLLTSPQRELGADAPPLLAPRAGEGSVTPHTLAPPPHLTSPPHSDGTLLATLAALPQPAALARDSSVPPTQEAQGKERFGKLPLYFEQNVGQTDAQVHFFTRGQGYGLFLTSTEAVMVLNQPAGEDVMGRAGSISPPIQQAVADGGWHRETDTPRSPEEAPAIVRMQILGGNRAPAVTGREQQPGKINYFLGNDPAQWHTNITTFGRVEYDEVYPGIDLAYYGNQRQLEYDFLVSPGADPNVIRLGFAGADRVELDGAGDLVLHLGEPGGVSPGSTLRQHAPVVYQEVGGQRREVASRFVLDEASGGRESPEVRFAVGAYDVTRPLVIDPVLSYSTFLGGDSGDSGYGLAMDPVTGDALVTGAAYSADFPTASPLQLTNRGGFDLFVTRLSATGSALVFSTYLGGGGTDWGWSLAMDPTTGDALVTGETDSTEFPTANPYQPTNRGGFDAFVTRLNAAGSALVYSTYLGGIGDDNGHALAVDPATGAVLVTGQTSSTDFPTANPLQPAHGGDVDVFVTRLSAVGSALVWSTYLGGSSWDSSYGLGVDPATGDALVTGGTGSPDFPTANALQPAHGGDVDVFVTRLSAAGSALVWSTYLGGSSAEFGYGLGVDPATGAALVTGWTTSSNFPTANALQPAHGGDVDVFVTRLSAAGSALVWSTYLGGADFDAGFALAVDPASGDALLTGQTASSNFPTANPLQPTRGGDVDVFVTRLHAAGSALAWSTYLGGADFDGGEAVAVDPVTGDVLVTGGTVSPKFPTTPGAFDRTCGTDGLCKDDGSKYMYCDAFVTRIGAPPVAYYYVYPDFGTVTAGVPFDLYVFALDARFHVILDYTGLILFYALDPLAQTPVYHQFERWERGVAYFPGGLTFNTPGFQELYVFDWPGVQVFGYAAFDVRP